jgi:hypothetical protein
MTTDPVYRRVLGTSPGFDWRKLRATVGLVRWIRMCELATVVGRFAGQYALPLDTEGEVALLRWLIDYNGPEQDAPRAQALMNLVDPASSLGDHYKGYYAELQRCLDPEKQWRPGPWAVQALDRFCREALTAYQAAVTTAEVMDPAQLSLSLPGPQQRVDRDEKLERETATSTVTDPVTVRKRPGPKPGKTDVIRQQRLKLIARLRRMQRGKFKDEPNSQTLDRFLGDNTGYKLPGRGVESHNREQLLRDWGNVKSK